MRSCRPRSRTRAHAQTEHKDFQSHRETDAGCADFAPAEKGALVAHDPGGAQKVHRVKIGDAFGFRLVATEWRETWAENLAKQQGKTKANFLAADRARYINGARITVDGGFSVNAR